MPTLGYKLMSEEHGPIALMRNAERAEAAGFAFAAISDHYFPWLEEQGHAPFVWSVLGGIARATRRLGLMTAVTCPIMRYHPAIVAQAAATMGVLSDGRFTLGLGAGERLNEHVVGQGWPGRVERHERLGEAIDVIRGLLSGELHSHRGRYFSVDHARLFDRPAVAPRLIVAAGGPDAARLAAEKGDGLIATEAEGSLIAAYRAQGGRGPRYAEVALCCADSEEAARTTAHRFFRWSLSGWPVLAELPDPSGFAAASELATPQAVARAISCGPSAERHLEAIGRYIDAGFDHIILTQVGPDQESLFRLFERELAPALGRRAAVTGVSS